MEREAAVGDEVSKAAWSEHGSSAYHGESLGAKPPRVDILSAPISSNNLDIDIRSTIEADLNRRPISISGQKPDIDQQPNNEVVLGTIELFVGGGDGWRQGCGVVGGRGSGVFRKWDQQGQRGGPPSLDG